MIQTPKIMLEQLNEVFASSDAHRLHPAMQKEIFKLIVNFSPATLDKLMSVIIQNWTSPYKPPSYADIKKMIIDYNATVAWDKGIRPTFRQKQIPANEEQPIPRHIGQPILNAILKNLGQKDKAKHEQEKLRIKEMIANATASQN
jgi:hypothetical protein